MELKDSGHSEAWDRGWLAAYQDDCENCQFASAGGKDRRSDMVAPDYIPKADVEEYLAGYREYCLKRWGDDWETCEFGWAPVLTIGSDDVTVGERVEMARKHLGEAYKALEDISTAAAEEYHEDARGALLSVMSGIRSLGEGLTKLQQKAGE